MSGKTASSLVYRIRGGGDEGRWRLFFSWIRKIIAPKTKSRSDLRIIQRTVILIMGFSILWIFMSDYMLYFVPFEWRAALWIDTLKGFCYTLVLGFVLYRILLGEFSRRAELEAVAEHQRRLYEEMFSQHSAAKMLLDPDTEKIIDANSSACLLFEKGRNEFLGEPIQTLCRIEETGNHKKITDLLNKQHGHFTVRQRIGEKDEKTIEFYCAEISVDDTAIIHVIAHDVTEKVQARKALVEARVEAEQASRAKSDFLAVMSHELRTPLNAIIGFSEIMAREDFGPIGSQYRVYSNIVLESGQTLLSIVNQILDITKVDTGEFEVSRRSAWPVDIVNGAISIVSGAASKSNITISVTDGGLRRPVTVDPLLLRQALVNLLSNAVKFSQDGSTVNCELEVNDNSVIIRIVDYGIGIAADQIDGIFEPFNRKGSALTRRHDGIGLGLPLAKRIIEAHQGQLELKSVPDNGTTVIITLPA